MEPDGQDRRRRQRILDHRAGGEHLLEAEKGIRESLQQVPGWITPERFTSGFTWTEYSAEIEAHADQYQANYAAAEEELSDDDKVFFSGYDRPVNVVIIGEDWCGDVVQNLPPIIRILEKSSAIEFRIFKRDVDVDIAYQYLTNGTRSIPKLAFFDEQFDQFAIWGPRPADCQRIMEENKGKIPMEEIYPQIRSWYQEHGNGDLVREIRGILEAHS